MKIKITCRPRYNPWLKRISRLLVFGILLNNMPINSFAGTLSENTRYETFLDSNLTITDILEEDNVDIKIEGNTLVNLIDLSKASSVNPLVTVTVSENKVNVNVNNKNYGQARIPISLLKPNTTYTLFCDITPVLLPPSNSKPWIDVFQGESKWIGSLSYGQKTFTFTTGNNVDNIHLRLLATSTMEEVASADFENIMILEGNYKNKDIGYFEGMNSVGELENNIIEIKSQNENLFNESKIKFDKSFIFKDGAYFMPKNTPTQWAISDFIDIKPNTTYTMTVSQELLNAGCRWSIATQRNSDNGSSYDEHCPNMIAVVRNKNSVTFTTDKNTTKILVAVCTDLGYEINRPEVRMNIKLEYGDVATKYIPYKEDKKEIVLSEPLRGLPNGVCDKIVKINGQWMIERNIGGIKGSDIKNITLSDSNNEYIKIRIEDLTGIRKNNSNSPILNNMFLFSGTSTNNLINRNFENIEVVETLDENHVNYNKHKGICYITLSKAKASNISEAKNWLNNSDLIIVYELANPIYEPIKVDLSVRLFEGTTHISNNSIIPATIEVTVDRTLNRAVEYTTLAKTNPTINNLSRARYWNNLLRDSIKKDQLQETVDNISRLNDMELERKTVSSNLDLYIKCENILMMSLSTNSITFEDFSGIEDMIKENAVQISINSSLPYQLNAYLPTEIQNADKSVTMDKDILNIKENSETAYQTFASTTDKVILKDNCPAGNNLIHGVDIKLSGGIAHEKDVYKTTIKFEAQQK